MKKLLAILLLFSAALCVSAQNGIIRELTGTVELKRPGTTVFTAARTGDSLSQDTVISTGFKSTAIIEIGSTVINVRPLTRLSLTEIAESSGNEILNVNLQAGRVRVDVNPPAGNRASATIISPVATASVRGTCFDFDTRNVNVIHGAVAFSGHRGHSMRVNAGSGCRIENDGKPADPVRNRAARMRPATPAGTDTKSGSSGDSYGSAKGTVNVVICFDCDF